jgi:hypothetical protein
LGGPLDSINDTYVAKGKSSLAGSVVLTPINLVISRRLTTDFRLQPIGAPTGVRMINIQDIEPASQIDVGGD